MPKPSTRSGPYKVTKKTPPMRSGPQAPGKNYERGGTKK